eukprot:TRINITY_DN10209_c0_g1_i2.p1 TRINITY_DN10209_c0_g1~~TRINITY_DN10209_c0_g1_i2.p1  ORF type:complete len:481 (-),score=82.73 TRINITY_DN10209_c0_g1_i2:129-1571(-)
MIMKAAGSARRGRGEIDELHARWRLCLDEDALRALDGLESHVAANIICELDSKGESVRNPSAYVIRAVVNARSNTPSPAATSTGIPYHVQASAAAHGVHSELQVLLGRLSLALDEKATGALKEMDPAAALRILQVLERQSETVTNPSAYIMKAVANERKGTAPGGCSPIQMGGNIATMVSALPLGHLPYMQQQSPPIQPVQQVRYVQQAQQPVVHAPLPYVQGYVSHASVPSAYMQPQGAGVPSQQAALDRAAAATFASLDPEAQQALAEVGTEVAFAILQVMEMQRGKVQNPSAYVLKAVGNAKKGKGAGGAAAMSAGSMHAQLATVPTDILGRWRTVLDSDALAALEGLNQPDAAHIIGELESKFASIRNPSAYVIRAATNARNSPFPSVGTADGCSSEERISEELTALMSRLPVKFDEKALQELREVGPAAALNILQVLDRQGTTVTNPSAYIMTAAANERRGIRPTGGAAKRARFT